MGRAKAAMLTDAQINELWDHFDVPEWGGWRASYAQLLSEIHALEDDALRDPAIQERLWGAKALSTLGPGEHVDVRGAWTDAGVVEAVVQLRRRAWPVQTKARAAAIQSAFGELLGKVSALRVGARPHGRLHRLMAVLLPQELHCAIAWSANRDVVELLLPPRRRAAPVESQVMARARLRDVLGDEAPDDWAAHAKRSMFCWWLHGQAEPLRRGHGLFERSPGLPEDDEGPLVLWPFLKQARGVVSMPRPLDGVRDLVRLAAEGAERDDLVEALGIDPAYSALSPRTRRALVRRCRLLGLLRDRDGLLVPTEAGEELLDNGQPDVLVARMAQRVFGAAHLLRWLTEAESAQSPALIRRLEALLPLWRGTPTPEAMLGWFVSLGLARRGAGSSLHPTDYGRGWAARLPNDLPIPPEGYGEHASSGFAPLPASTPAERVSWPDFGALAEAVSGRPLEVRLTVSRERLQALYLAWRRGFVVLSGLSGTGKTALTLAFAHEACGLLGLDVRRHVELVPVSPDWRDPSGLLGYFNALHAEPSFWAEPALRLLLRASQDRGRPYFLILDEMNLARVEQYLAPALSAMETGGDILLHAHDGPVDGVPPRVRWPRNLFIAGTVNMDETTRALSDKVLDRAFVLEFWSVDLASFFNLRAERGQPRIEGVEALLTGLQAALSPVRCHFGYRAAGQVLDFVAEAIESGMGETVAADLALGAKVLPKIRGEDTPGLRRALEETVGICAGAGLSRCERKLRAMRERLLAVGMTRFWA